mmetsp:Transcript_1343/g.5109  ORF Transcript_1343/g.5109 Transcript_1343/m.5109 type:complete len:631 (-) Transcript_1343:377-2269(-)
MAHQCDRIGLLHDLPDGGPLRRRRQAAHDLRRPPRDGVGDVGVFPRTPHRLTNAPVLRPGGSPVRLQLLLHPLHQVQRLLKVLERELSLAVDQRLAQLFLALRRGGRQGPPDRVREAGLVHVELRVAFCGQALQGGESPDQQDGVGGAQELVVVGHLLHADHQVPKVLHLGVGDDLPDHQSEVLDLARLPPPRLLVQPGELLRDELHVPEVLGKSRPVHGDQVDDPGRKGLHQPRVHGAHQAKVDEDEVPVGGVQDVPLVRVGVDQASLQQHRAGGLDSLGHEVELLVQRELPQLLPLAPLHGEHALRGVSVDVPGDLDVRQESVLLLKLPRVGGLLPVVQLVPDARGHLVGDGGEVRVAPPKDPERDEAEPQDVHVHQQVVQNLGPLDLHGHHVPLPGLPLVDLAQGGARHGLFPQGLEQVVLLRALGFVSLKVGPRHPRRDGPVPLEAVAQVAHGVRRGEGLGVVLELGKLARRLVTDEVAPRAQRLPALDEGGAEVVDRPAQHLSPRPLVLGQGLLAPPLVRDLQSQPHHFRELDHDGHGPLLKVQLGKLAVVVPPHKPNELLLLRCDGNWGAHVSFVDPGVLPLAGCACLILKELAAPRVDQQIDSVLELHLRRLGPHRRLHSRLL